MQWIYCCFGIAFSTSVFFISTIQGFEVGVRKTSCSLAKGNYNNPCESLYDAVCDGAHCKCPSGFREDKALRRCVKGSTKSSKGTDDLFDLPFDYDPNKKKDPSTGPKVSPSDAQTPTGTQNRPGGTYPGGYPQQPSGYPQQPSGYPQQPGGFPQQPGGFPQQPGGYPQQPGRHPQQPAGYPQQPGGYPQKPAGYPQQPGRYPQQPGGYPQQPGGYPQRPGGYPQQPGRYPQQPSGYPKQPERGYPRQPGNRPNQPGGTSYGKETGGGVGGGLGILILLAIIYFCCCRGEKGKKFQKLFNRRNNNPGNVPPGPGGAYPMNTFQGQEIYNVPPEQNKGYPGAPPPYDQQQQFIPHQPPGPYQPPGTQQPPYNITPGQPQAPPLNYGF